MWVGSSSKGDRADAGLVIRLPNSLALARRTFALTLLVVCIAAVPAVALGAGQGGDQLEGEGIGNLAPADEVIDGSAVGVSNTDATDDASPFGGVAGAAEAEPITGTTKQLRAQVVRLTAAREVSQRVLLTRTLALENAEAALDGVLVRYAERIVVLFDGSEPARLSALMTVRDAQDALQRAELIAALDPADRVIGAAHVAALERVGIASSAAAVARTSALEVDARITAINDEIERRTNPTANVDDGQESVRADYIFATGPIPGIGYWGAAAGGDPLAGWTGLVGAAIGGIGCDAPPSGLKATGQIESGDSSWYGPGFDGNNTASGEVYDQTAMTAAHKTLPFGTMVRVYNTANARCAFVRINDRGPYIDGRIIDLSKSAADAIGMSGVAPVQIEVWAGDEAGASNAPS